MKAKNLPFVLFALSAVALAACSGEGDCSIHDSIISSTGGSVDTTPLFTVTFNCCNGEKPAIATRTGHAGDKLELISAPKVANYSFVGWSSKYSAATKCGTTSDIIGQAGDKIDITGNLVLYGCYVKADAPVHTEADIDAYMEQLKSTSEDGHLYYHYYRYLNSADAYAPWDVWAWSYKPTAGEGARFDWNGRTTSSDGLSATGDARFDDFGGAVADIDLTQTYNGGWDATEKSMGGMTVSFAGAKQIGLQIVQSASRTSSSGFWVNDGSNLYVTLDDYAMDLGEGKKAYHVFVVQDAIQNPLARPTASTTNPFDEDDGTNVTYGDKTYEDVDWSTPASMTKTSEDFASLGVGYQIMVSSFADSDGDGFGDIYGITQKLDYLEALGVKALWLTPIQLSDSYHGYDITDYEKVDPKYGSSVSPAGIANKGVVDSYTALEDYKDLIAKAHEKGMKIVMDLVLNHTSTSNAWFVKSANLDAEYRGFYQWGNHNTQSGIDQDHFWYPYGDHPYSFYAKFGSSMPELNYSYKSTREAVCDMSTYWVKDVGVDGFRLDAVKHIYMLDEVASTSGDTVIIDNTVKEGKQISYSSDLTKNLHFFKELKAKVSADSGKNVFFVGENFDGHAYHVAPYYEAFDSMFDFYSYFNLTSAAATGRAGNTSAFGTAQGFMANNSTYNTSADTANANDAGGILAKANNSAWNFPDVYKTYNKYRGDTSLPGLFTSNHDIARVINRIAGSGTASGLQAQGTVTSSNYASLEQSANCVKIAELMFPGVTWVYYGDELGMTGNFPEGKDDTASYADLWYRQPMKWVENGVKGDGHYSTDYYVTGSSQKVGYDDINSTAVVVPAETQMADPTSDFSTMAKFIALKNGSQTLINGSMKSENFASGNLAANVLCFSRTLNGETIKVAVNFNSTPMSAYGLSGTVLASYNGASASSLPAYSAIVVKA